MKMNYLFEMLAVVAFASSMFLLTQTPLSPRSLVGRVIAKIEKRPSPNAGQSVGFGSSVEFRQLINLDIYTQGDDSARDVDTHIPD